jgi:putative inorganic carbon (HCO3(-)) transporter
MTDLYIALIYASFFVVGVTAPFVLTLGYVWCDLFYPQVFSTLIALIQSSMVMAIAALSAYFLVDRRTPPRFGVVTALTLLFAAWCTLTLNWAEVPIPAAEKWNWAFKTIVVSAFVPLVIRSRVQIEAFLQVYLFAAMLHMFPVGVKTMISGSGYGRAMGVGGDGGGNAGLFESSSLAAASIAVIPIILFLRNHSILLPKSKLRDLAYLGLVFIAVMSAIGTYARTALVGFVVVFVFLFLQSRRKVLLTVMGVIIALGVGSMVAQSWDDRISTISDYREESSALTRILVSKWTIGYVAEHPLGGGFNSSFVDRIEYPSVDGQAPVVYFGKAFHNIYFEVLGEQGYPGLLIYVLILGITLVQLRRIAKRTRGKPHLQWCADLAAALITSLLTLMACGNFIGVAYQSFLWYMIALPVCLVEYVHRVDMLDKPTVTALQSGRMAEAAVAGATRLVR